MEEERKIELRLQTVESGGPTPGACSNTAEHSIIPGTVAGGTDGASGELANWVQTGVFVLRSQTVVYANPAMERLTGYSRTELSARGVDHICPHMFENLMNDQWLTRTGQGAASLRCKTSIKTKTGDERPVECLVSQGFYQGLPSTIVTCIDTAEQSAVLNATRDIIALVDTDGTILRANKSLARRLNVTAYELIGSRVFDHFPPDIAAERASCFNKAIKTGKIVRHEDSLAGRYYESCYCPLFEEEERVSKVAIFARDITEGKLAEQRTKESEQALKTILLASPVGIVRIRNRIIDWANDAVSRATLYSREELTGSSTRLFYESDEEFQRVGNILYTEGQVETVFVGKDGSLRNVLINAAPIDGDGHIVTISDITRQKHIENTLAFTQFAMDHAHVSIYWINEDGKLIYANDAACEASGYSRDELLSITIMDIDPDFTVERWRKHWATKKRVGSMTFESRHRSKDGRIYPVQVSADYLCYGNTEYNCAIVLDITERRKTEERVLIQRNLALELAETSSFAEALPRCINTALQVTGMDSGAIFTFDAESGDIRPCFEKGLSTQFVKELCAVKAGSSVRNISMTGEPFYCAPLCVDPGVSPALGRLSEGLRAVGIIPITHGGKVMGLLGIASHTSDTISDVHRNLLETIAAQVGAVMRRVTIEEELRRSEEKYRSIFENAKEGIFQSTLSGVFLSANPAMVRMHGYASPEELTHAVKDIGEQIYVNPRRRRELVDLLLKDGAVYDFETEVFRKDRTKLWVSLNMRAVRDANGHALYLEGTSEDITRRKETEAALQESEAKYRSVVEESHVGFYILQDDVFRYVNKRFCEIHGYTHDEIVNKIGPMDLILPEDRDKAKQSMIRRSAGQMNYIEYEVRTVRKDNEILTLRVIATNLLYHGAPAITGTVLDVTKEKNLEAQLLHSQKLEAIGQLAGGIAHDFNNILSAIIGYASLFKMKLGADDPFRTYLDQILSASHKATRLTQSLLTFGRKQPIELRPLGVNSIIAGVEKLLKRLLTEDIDLRIKFTDPDPTVMADSTNLDQVLINIATNARDAMPKGGALSIETAVFTMDSQFVNSQGFGYPGSYALITLTDTGVGMDKETQRRLFEPFFTTKEVGKGTGLGLSIVYGIIKQHGGFIAMESALGKGTTVRIYLPRISIIEEKTEAILPPPQRGTETILVAEDDRHLRYIMRTVLASKGYTVIEAEDGLDAVNKFTKHKGGISLVVLDVVMPRKNGKEVYDEIRRISPDARVLFMSGYASDILEQKGFGEQKVDFISKPVLPDDILRKVRAVLDK
ncbi:MAG: Blue-light-activated protein [Syntrophorhabdus sp. PtaU1.Bin153]|nr:MAG: Blue-light-activated protein [Syntrophorhabdus sp. PtaU1.Bin153]